MSDRDLCRRWTIAIGQLRARAARLRRGALPPEVAELLDESLNLSETVVRELAGTGLAFDAFKVQADAQQAQWLHLFDAVPIACVDTDAAGVICNANRAAARLLNTTVKHLGSRLLMHFAEDREGFGQLLHNLSPDGSGARVSLVIRPRERAPVHVDATIVPRVPGQGTAWLWFFSPAERLPVTGRRADTPLARDGGSQPAH